MDLKSQKGNSELADGRRLSRSGACQVNGWKVGKARRETEIAPPPDEETRRESTPRRDSNCHVREVQLPC